MRQRDDLVFPMSEYERRLAALRTRMAERDIDVMITTTPENICYLSGFESPGHYYFNALAVPMEGEAVAVPRNLEVSGYNALTWVEDIQPYMDYEHPLDVLGRVLKARGWDDKRIGYEKGCWFFTAAQQERLFDNCPSATYIDCSGIVEAGRVIKSEYEIDLMRSAARAAEAGMRAGIDAVQAGVTEADVAAEIHYAMIKAGSEWPSIVPFVASGERGAIGHATWTDRVIKSGESVFLEIGGCLKRYHAAMMRTVFLGDPDQSMWEGEKLVHQAMQASIEAIKPGVKAHDIDTIGREIIGGSSLGAEQGSRAGYSIGIALPPDWGEGHILSLQQHEMRPLQANMTFHLIPWAQIPGKGGIGFSETVRVTEDGCEIVTSFDRKLFVK